MYLLRFNDDRIGVLHDGGVVDVTDIAATDAGDFRDSMTGVIAHLDTLTPLIKETLQARQAVPLDELSLLTPIESPSKIVAAPVNYRDHIQEMRSDERPERVEMFLKAPSALTGPNTAVVLPSDEWRIDHEAELVMVISKKAFRVPLHEALDYVGGYTCGLDITVRGPGDRSMRKSFDTFAPVGPWIATPDEISDPDNLFIQFWINEERRQAGSTQDMIFGCAQLIEGITSVMTLEPGDLVFTGTPSGVGPLHAGDVIRIDIESIGNMGLTVDLRD